MANVGNVFYPTFTNVFFLIFSTFFTFFNVFFYFHLNVYYICDFNCWKPVLFTKLSSSISVNFTSSFLSFSQVSNLGFPSFGPLGGGSSDEWLQLISGSSADTL